MLSLMTSSEKSFHPYDAAPMRRFYDDGRDGLFRESRPFDNGGHSKASATGPGNCEGC
ncbi:hypothetical protein DPMN_000385 [Dreissena polymorpha]|uniref:Uncharacterized protein n=1 Tax=Dreissena polymorpha TaxID=45954 RepID=A0A9D4RRZ6_DREPO|nr:hypothetical protein DPMN_000385 [Dreissena polymorpha]